MGRRLLRNGPDMHRDGARRSAAGLDGAVAFLLEVGDHLVPMVALELDARTPGGAADPAVLLQFLGERLRLRLAQGNLGNGGGRLALAARGLPLHFDRRTDWRRTGSRRRGRLPAAFLLSPLLFRAEISAVAGPDEFRVGRHGRTLSTGSPAPGGDQGGADGEPDGEADPVEISGGQEGRAREQADQREDPGARLGSGREGDEAEAGQAEDGDRVSGVALVLEDRVGGDLADDSGREVGGEEGATVEDRFGDRADEEQGDDVGGRARPATVLDEQRREDPPDLAREQLVAISVKPVQNGPVEVPGDADRQGDTGQGQGHLGEGKPAAAADHEPDPGADRRDEGEVDQKVVHRLGYPTWTSVGSSGSGAMFQLCVSAPLIYTSTGDTSVGDLYWSHGI